jgi:hypothetical protein
MHFMSSRNGTGASSCQDCPAGFFQPSLGGDTCIPVRAADRDAQVYTRACSSCIDVCASMRLRPVQCNGVLFSTTNGSTQCQSCPVGLYLVKNAPALAEGASLPRMRTRAHTRPWQLP